MIPLAILLTLASCQADAAKQDFELLRVLKYRANNKADFIFEGNFLYIDVREDGNSLKNFGGVRVFNDGSIVFVTDDGETKTEKLTNDDLAKLKHFLRNPDELRKDFRLKDQRVFFFFVDNFRKDYPRFLRAIRESFYDLRSRRK